MGGCKCSYRNCTVKSDKRTHFFHYPVFDKVRCHQWLTNAQRLDFLKLSVSQLRNRNVCQHHFTDDMFMNFMKDKLKHYAVPTEDGPYCEYVDESVDVQKGGPQFPIQADLIDNEVIDIADERISKYGVKYGDFLTNCDLMDVDFLGFEDKKTSTQINVNNSKQNKIIEDNYIINNNKDILDNVKAKTSLNYTLPVVYEPVKSKTKNNQSNIILLNKENTNVSDNTFSNTNMKSIENFKSRKCKKDSKIIIISDESYSQPLPAVSSLTPVSKGLVLNKMMKQNNIEIIKPSRTISVDELAQKDDQIVELVIEQPHEIILQDIASKVDVKPMEEMAEIKNLGSKKSLLNLPKTQSRNFSVTKVIPRKRVADLEQKRMFNKKLRDIISDSMDKLDEQSNITMDIVNSKLKDHYTKEKVINHLSNDNQLNVIEKKIPSLEHHLIDYLDGRMKRMENLLLNRIDGNTQSIRQLKSIYEKGRKRSEKTFSVSTQTNHDELSHKKSLYSEISQYLSPELKSLVYEQMFLNSDKRRVLRGKIKI